MGIRIASLNLNRRVSKKRWQGELVGWLEQHSIELILAQEPTVTQDLVPQQIGGFRPLGGNERVFAWISEEVDAQVTSVTGPFWQLLDFNGIYVWNVYLDANSTGARSTQLAELNRLLEQVPSEPIIVLGDFNIAPTPEDGLYGGAPSTFNNRTDRVPLSALQETMRLVDLRPEGGRREFTVERMQRGKMVQFRCDLALVSRHVINQVALTYDHGVRDRSDGFTDHSALIVDVDVASVYRGNEA